MAISDFTANLKTYAERGPGDLKLSTETRDEYLKLIADLRKSFQTVLEQANVGNMGEFGNVGGLASAQQTKRNLQIDAANFRHTIRGCIKYTDELEAVVTKAATNILKSG
ncbi:hypothetical protein [Mycolicibacterium sp.]|uniref:hypothetical protein n=1 Tax=Mycolicibacterium sp. TaxID=2320850 RepID=UPI003D13B6D8